MAKKALKTPNNNNGVRRSTRIKYHVQRLAYDGFVAHHYAYMVKVIQEVEPTCFEQAIGNPKWDNAMDEKMAVLDANATWESVALPKDKKAHWSCHPVHERESHAYLASVLQPFVWKQSICTYLIL
jgi:hypothetical protein